eukprot:11460531-Alexandrium_andersonii.AAC.1
MRVRGSDRSSPMHKRGLVHTAVMALQFDLRRWQPAREGRLAPRPRERRRRGRALGRLRAQRTQPAHGHLAG